jgi:uncharacterized protein YkwD
VTLRSLEPLDLLGQGATSTWLAPRSRHLLALAGADPSPCAAPPCPILRPDLAGAMLPLINADRATLHLGPLSIDARLQACAEWKAINCASQLYLDHDDHGTPLERTIWQRFAVYYPTSAAAGENLAYGFLDAATVMQAFLSDVGHKANVENTSWLGVGLAVAQVAPSAPGGAGLLFWGQDYGSDHVPGPVPPPPPPPPPVPSGVVLDRWLTEVLPLIQATSQHQKWLASTSSAGRADVRAWNAYLASPHGAPPTMRTPYGRSLVADLHLAATV